MFYRWTIAMNKSKHYYTFLTQCVQHRLLTSRKIRCKLKLSTISARRTWNVQISCLDIKLLKKPILLKAVIYEWRNANSLLVQLHCIRKEIALGLSTLPTRCKLPLSDHSSRLARQNTDPSSVSQTHRLP